MEEKSLEQNPIKRHQPQPTDAQAGGTAADSPSSDSGLEGRLATTLAPMLFAVAAFALTALGPVKEARCTYTDEFLAGLALLSIFTGALLIDSVLDKVEEGKYKNEKDRGWIVRFTYLQGGYALFCFIILAMTVLVFIFYGIQQFDDPRSYPWHWGQILCFVLAGFSVFLKMMTYRDPFGFTFIALIALSYIVSITVSFVDRPPHVCSSDSTQQQIKHILPQKQ